MNKHFLYLLFAVFLSCTGQKSEHKNPPGYELDKPEKFLMPDVLNEISGICFYQGNPDTLYGEQDEEGKLFYLHPGDKKASHVKFGKKGDYEDLVISREQVVLLRSDGTLFSFPFNAIHQEEIMDVKEWNNLLPAGEYEGLCTDAKNSQLYALCKQCDNDETGKGVTAYMLEWQPDGSIKQNGSSSISVKTIEKLAGEKKMKFRPSALAQNPQTQEWYILSAVNQMLVVAGSDWSVKEVYPLDPALFRQPEGIAFDGENNLYISNEGDNISKGNVLKFVFKKNN